MFGFGAGADPEDGLSLTGLEDFLPGLTLGSTIPFNFSITILDLDSELELCIWYLPKLSVDEFPFMELVWFELSEVGRINIGVILLLPSLVIISSCLSVGPLLTILLVT